MHYRIKYIPGRCHIAQRSEDGQHWLTVATISTRYGNSDKRAQAALARDANKREQDNPRILFTWHSMVIG